MTGYKKIPIILSFNELQMLGVKRPAYVTACYQRGKTITVVSEWSTSDKPDYMRIEEKFTDYDLQMVKIACRGDTVTTAKRKRYRIEVDEETFRKHHEAKKLERDVNIYLREFGVPDEHMDDHMLRYYAGSFLTRARELKSQAVNQG